MYLATIDGFDTHADQQQSHPTLLRRLADGLSAFYSDLRASGHSGNVTAMTFSEFGRTIHENGSVGTDHGTGSPMFIISENMGSRFHGTAPNLTQLDNYGDPFFSVDFREVYATVLERWLCVDPELVGSAMGRPLNRLEELLPAVSPTPPMNDPAALLGHQPADDEAGVILIKYALRQRGPLRLSVVHPNGGSLRVLTEGFAERGSYTFRFRPQQYYLSPGQYRYRLETAGRVFERNIQW